jgi:hypothetical protein
MKIVVQRVLNASVTVDGQIISKIGRGLMVLVGLTEGDCQKDIDYMVSYCRLHSHKNKTPLPKPFLFQKANKVVNGKFFDCKEKGPWRASVKNVCRQKNGFSLFKTSI